MAKQLRQQQSRQREVQRIFTAIRSMHQRNRTVANLYGLSRSLAEAHATVEVAAHPGISPSELAKRLGLSPVSMTRVLSSAYDAGFVRWSQDAKDRRLKRLKLGPKAETFLRQNLERNVATFGAAYERLSTQGRRRFQQYLQIFCDGWAAPPAAATPEEPPLMSEIRRLTRALGLLTDKLSFAPWCPPLKWHVLTLARAGGSNGVSSKVLSSSLAAAPKLISDLLRTLKSAGLVRCGRLQEKAVQVTIAPKGIEALDDLERAAITQFERCLERLSTEQLAEFASLWEHYSGQFVTPLVQAITKGTILQCVESEDARAEARAFIFEQRVKQRLLSDLPASVVAPESVVFVLYRFKNPTAVVELVRSGTGEWRAASFLTDPNLISSNTIRQLMPIFLQNALLITNASKLDFERAHTSRAVWGFVAPAGESRASVSLEA